MLFARSSSGAPALYVSALAALSQGWWDSPLVPQAARMWPWLSYLRSLLERGSESWPGADRRPGPLADHERGRLVPCRLRSDSRVPSVFRSTRTLRAELSTASRRASKSDACDERIGSVLDADFCSDCRRPVHARCRKPGPPRCRDCGVLPKGEMNAAKPALGPLPPGSSSRRRFSTARPAPQPRYRQLVGLSRPASRPNQALQQMAVLFIGFPGIQPSRPPLLSCIVRLLGTSGILIGTAELAPAGKLVQSAVDGGRRCCTG
jgi:hypothetical protein